MTLLGRGFRGLAFTRPGGTSLGAAYTFGLLFALGWTACVGPILGSILTMLLADGASTSGTYSIVSGAALAQIYVLGMGLPILILVTGLTRGVSSRDVGRLINGREIGLNLAGRSWSVNLISLISGLLLIGLGIMLYTGTMTRLTQELGSSGLARWVVEIEERLPD
jgi:cytochrome c-type biogenesis protein